MSTTFSHRLKLWLNIVTFIALGVIIYAARHDIIAAFEKMRQLNLWVLLLILPMQLLSFYTLARVYKACFVAIGAENISVKQLFPAAIELNFVNHILPSGGVSGFSYLTFRLKELDISTAKSTLAQLARFVSAFATFIALLLVAVLILAFDGKASNLIIFIATTLTLIMAFGMLTLGYVIGSRARIRQFAALLTRIMSKITQLLKKDQPKPAKLSAIEETFNELHTDYLALRTNTPRVKQIIYWALITNLLEVGQIYIAFVAHGAWINPGALIIAYAVATVAGLLAILPGGLGVYEPLMVGVLLSAGVPNDLAVSATLVARVVTLTFTLGLGYALYHKTLRHLTKK